MKKNKLLAAAMAASLLCAAAVSAQAADITVDQSKAVIDNAGILSEETEEYVTEISTALGDACGAQIGVYTVEYIGNTTIDEYTYEVASQWGIGDADKDNGVVLLLAPGEDNYFAVQGTGLERTLSSSTLGDILEENLEPYWVDADYDTGTCKTVKALADRICSIYDVSISTDSESIGNSTQASNQDQGEGGLGFMGILFIILAIVLVIILLGGSHRHDPPPPPGGGFGTGFLFGSMLGSGRRYGHRPPPPHGGGFGGGAHGGGFGGGSHGGGGFHSGGGSFGGGHSGGFHSGGGGFHSGGGSFRGGGAGRR